MKPATTRNDNDVTVHVELVFREEAETLLLNWVEAQLYLLVVYAFDLHQCFNFELSHVVGKPLRFVVENAVFGER